MATTLQPTLAASALALLKDLGAGLKMIAAYVGDLSHGVSSTRKAMQLQQLSDEDLNKLGITRDQIVPYAFGDIQKMM